MSALRPVAPSIQGLAPLPWMGTAYPQDTERNMRDRGVSFLKRSTSTGGRRSTTDCRVHTPNCSGAEEKARLEALGRDCRAKFQELRKQFKTIRRHYLLIVCAWCNKRMRWQYLKDASPVYTSHSICQLCAAQMSKDLGVEVVQRTA